MDLSPKGYSPIKSKKVCNNAARAWAKYLNLPDDFLDPPIPDLGDDFGFKRIQIPLIRRIYPQLMANKIVEVQPLRTACLIFPEWRYAENKGSQRSCIG